VRNFYLCVDIIHDTGDSGLVYKAYLSVSDGTEIVAVKTGKGEKQI